LSVKFDEAFCFDSFQDRLLWFDDFHGDQLQDEWNGAGVGGTGVVVDQQTGGIVRLTTGAAINNNYRIDWADIRNLLVTKRLAFEFRMNMSTTANILIRNFLRFDWNNCIFFEYDSAALANWSLYCRDGGAQTNVDSGIAADTNYHVFRIECHIHGASHVHFYIDGVECGNSPVTTNVPDDAGDYLQPYLRIETLENAAKSMDVDYCYIREDR